MYHVLVVDDQPRLAAPLVKLLGRNGCVSRTAGGGVEALAVLAADPPELVLLDVMMPGMDGYQVLAAIRAERRWDVVTVLMYSALSDVDGRDRAVGLGAQGWVVKATPFDRLLAEVRRHLVA